MIQKTKSQTKRLHVSTQAGRKQAFDGSTSFNEALVVVRHDLQRAAAIHASDVMGFLSWVRKNGHAISRARILEKIDGYHKDVRDSLRLYIGFVLRFRVCLGFRPRDGALELVPIYEVPRHSQLTVGVRGGELIPPPAEPDADVRDLFVSIGGMPAQIRRGIKKKGSRILMSEQIKEDDSDLMKRGLSEDEVTSLRAVQRKRGSNPEDDKLRIFDVYSGDTSSLTQLLDAAYDPLSITFLLVRSRGQVRLMSLVGELVSDYEWNQMGVVRANVHEVLWGKAPAGAPLNFQQFAQDIGRIPPDGKISRNAAIDALGDIPTETDIKRMEKRLQRATSRADSVRRNIAL